MTKKTRPASKGTTTARGKFLTAFLALTGIGLLSLLLNLIAEFNSPRVLDGLYPHSTPEIILAYRTVGFFVQATMLLGISRWKRRAVYGYFAFWAIDAILSTTVFAPDLARLPQTPVPPHFAPWAFLTTSASFAALGILAIRRKWSAFT